MAARRPILRWVDQATINSASVAQYAALVDVTSDDQQKVALPAGAKALRYHGIMNMGQMSGVTPAVGDKVSMQKTGRAYTLLAGVNGGSAKAVLPGDWAVIHNALGHTTAYVLASGTTMLLGMYRTKYTNSEATAGVPVEMDQHPQLVIQTEAIRGGADTIAAKIREIARAHDVPILERPPLARWIYRHVAVGADTTQATVLEPIVLPTV